MNVTRKLVVVLAARSPFAASAWAGGAKEVKKLPPGPAFDSAATTAGRGNGEARSQQASPKPIKIAVLGLENNPFWIPVKEGTLKAAEELEGR